MTNPNLKPDQNPVSLNSLVGLLNNKSDAELAILASETTAPEVLNALAAHPNHVVIRAVIHNSAITEQTIKIILENESLSPELLAEFQQIAEKVLIQSTQKALLSQIQDRVRLAQG
jgi:hypothetical protein